MDNTMRLPFCYNYCITVPSARVIVQPLKMMVPLFTRLVTVKSPVSVHTQPDPTVMTALFSAAAAQRIARFFLVVFIRNDILLGLWCKHTAASGKQTEKTACRRKILTTS